MDKRRLTPTSLCRRLDLLPQNYSNWANEGLLAKPSKGDLRLLDGVELAVLAKLNDVLGLRRVRGSWPKLRTQLRDRLAVGEVYVVYRQMDDELELALTLEEAGRFATDAGLVRIVSVTEFIALVGTAFARARASNASEGLETEGPPRRSHRRPAGGRPP